MKKACHGAVLAVLVLSSYCRAQEFDPDTVAAAESLGWIDELMLDAVPGSSLLVRHDRRFDDVALRVRVDHPAYRAGIIRTPTVSERPLWWLLLRRGSVSVGAGDLTGESGLGTILSVAQGRGRSRVAPITPGPQSVRGGVGDVRGVTGSYAIDTACSAHLMVGRRDANLENVAAAWLNVDARPMSASFTGLVRQSPSRTAAAVAAAMRTHLDACDLGAELAADDRRRLAMQLFASSKRSAVSTSLSLWYAQPGSDFPLGAVLATSESMVNSWGAMLRGRVTERGVLTARCAVTLFGRPWRTRLLPMASAGFEFLADVEQRVTSRLLIEWRLWHRHDEDGVSGIQRQQLQRILWSGRIRAERIVSADLTVRANIDLRFVRCGNEAWSAGSFGWLDLRWRVAPSSVMRLRAAVYASESSDAAITTVEYASQGLQTMVRGLGWGRRMSASFELQASPLVTLALQAAISSALRGDAAESETMLRLSAQLRMDPTNSAKTSALRADGRHEPRE